MAPSLDNLVTASLQITGVALAAWAATAVLRVTAPGLRYGFWRCVLVICLALPWLQPLAPPERAGDWPAAAATSGTAVAFAPTTVTASAVDWALWLAVLITAGVGFRILWLAVGCLRLRRLRRLGLPAPVDDHQPLQVTLGTNAEVRYVTTVQQPVTFGVWRPIVLLPDTLRQQAQATRQAIIAHELVHVRRRDWCWVLAEETIRAVLWFHPAIWWLISRVQLAREEVVDGTVVAITGRRRDYVQALLAFADDVPLAPAPAFARRRHLFHRIVLLSTEEVMSARRLIVSAVVMAVVVAAAGWTAVRALPLQAGASALLQSGIGPLEQIARPITPDNPIPRLVHQEPPLFPPAAAGENIAATVTLQMVIDNSGAVGEVRLDGLAFQTNGFNAAMSGGPDTLKQLEQFRKTQFIAKPGETRAAGESVWPLLQAFIDSAVVAVRQWRYEPPRDGPIAFDTVIRFADGKARATRAVSPVRSQNTSLGAGAVRVGGGVKVPTKIKDVKPVYPQEAKEARVQGVVIAEVRIDADGRVGAAQILRSIPLLDQAALDAVRQWEFMPTLLNGVPTPVVMTVTVQFSLQ